MKNLIQGATVLGLAMMPSVALADWSGSYIGISGGEMTDSSYEVSNSVSDDGQAPLSDTSTLSIYGGQMTQNGQIVFGVEIDVLFAPDADIAQNITIDDAIVDMKIRTGFALDRFLAYGVVGGSFISSTFGPNDINASGLNFGAGVDFMLTDNLIIGAEYLARRTSEEFLDADVEIEMDTVSLRATYKF